MAVLGTVLLIAAGLWSLRPASPGPVATHVPRANLPLPAAVADAPLTAPVVMWVAQATARFEPCGCVAGMHGGLMRRASLTARLPRERVLSLELGGWSGGSRSHEHLRSRFYLRGLAAAGIAAVALGTTDIALGPEKLGGLLAEAQLLGLPIASANLDGLPGCVPAVALTAGGRRFLVTSVVPASTTAGLTSRDPIEAVATQAAESVRQQRDLVVMADLEPDACLALARAVPQIALIIGGRSDHPSPEPIGIGTTRVLWAGNHGKVLGSWAWSQRAAAFELLHDQLPEDPAQRALVDGYQQALAKASFDSDPGHGLRALGSAVFTGSASCFECHAAAAQTHKASLHHHAFAALERKGYQHDPDCLRCHVTGLGEGGYQRGVAAFAEVGCESCHGPGSAHVAAARAGRPADAALPQLSAASCVICHDAENSPHFDYSTYWPRIRH